MNKILAIFAALAISTSAFAADGDFNKTGVVVEAESEAFGIGLGTGATTDFSDTAQVLDLHSNLLPVVVGIKIVDDSVNDTRDYRLYVNKTFEVEVGAGKVYATPELSTTDGNSYTARELRVSPTLGYAHDLGTVVPFVEARYNWTSHEGDYLNFSRADSSTAVGVKVPVTPSADITVAMVDERDKDFSRLDREVVVKFGFKF